MKVILSIDIGGTNQRFALIDQNGNVIKKTSCKNPDTKISGEYIEHLFESISQASKEQEVEGLAFALPIVVDQTNAIVQDAPNLKHLVGVDLHKSFKQMTQLPYIVENDANCAALGEYWKGAGVDLTSFACLTFGTGIGGGLVLDKKLWKGNAGMASEIGHMKIDMSEESPCNCGDSGCLESFISASAIQRRFNQSPKELFEHAQQGDDKALEIFKDIGEKLGVGLASIANLLNIDDFIIGGRMAGAFEYFYPHALRVAKQRAMKGPGQNIHLRKAKLGDNAGLVGAAYLLKQSQKVNS